MSETNGAKRVQKDYPSDGEAEEMAKKRKLYQELWSEAETRGLLTSEICGVLDEVENLRWKIHTLRETIKMDQIIQRNDEIMQRNDEIMQRNDEIMQRNLHLEVAIAEKDKEVAATEDLRQTSIEQTYLDTKKNFRLPGLTLNNNVTPSVSGNSRKINYYDKKNRRSVDGYLKIPKAKILVHNGHYVHPSHVRIPVCTDNADNKLIPSVLGASRSRYRQGDNFDYSNEFGVQRLCVSMVEDALGCLNLAEARVNTEISIFLMKPDIVVVLRIKGKILFAVEVKSPDARDGNHNDKVFTSENTAGQIWSFLLAMRSTGIQQPLGAVMTYNKMVLASLESFDNDSAHKEILEKVKTTLSTNKKPPPRMQKVPENCKDQTFSPIRETFSASKFLKDADDTKKEAYKEKQVDPVVYYSQVFENGYVFPFLLQAIEMAFQKVQSNVATDIPDIDHGEYLGKRVVCKVGKNFYDWVQTPSCIKNTTKPFSADCMQFPPPSSQIFYLLGELGVGSHASVILACNSSCRVCALKCFHVEPSQKSTEPAREEEENRTVEKLREMVDGEAVRWGELYKDRFPDVNAVDLGGRPCLVMPYGKQVKRRDSFKTKVKQELYRFAKQGYRYKNDDIRWRHVLVDSKGELFLSGLGSLEEHREETTHKKLQAIVDKQMAILMPKNISHS